MKRQELKESKEASQNLILESKNEHTRKINFKTNGITLIALVITMVLHYDKVKKCSNSNSFLLSSI